MPELLIAVMNFYKTFSFPEVRWSEHLINKIPSVLVEGEGGRCKRKTANVLLADILG